MGYFTSRVKTTAIAARQCRLAISLSAISFCYCSNDKGNR
ncbi:hypothetical protein CPS_1370 [Colwellia psychrerythraea 34H]|uniref:Uncharacterized protein n=1 Tax=Colwellia psychrerythraea (strain 34H / ATCC BAA-681) TaxID=167879 RepID=Q486A2_COLP3|nr:hypothetical protein CPS_1370 [Colwellia psychrerythraea 34H]